jgi:hypothetical protein
MGKSIEQAQTSLDAELQDADGVIGTAIGTVDNRPGILVMVVSDSAAKGGQIPSEYEGYPVKTIVTGSPSLFDGG